MSVIFQAQGYIIYETPDALAVVLEHLQETTQMDQEYPWLDGHNRPILPIKQAEFPEWNGLKIPHVFVYRGLNVPDLLEGAMWAKVITSALSSAPSTRVYDESGVVEEINIHDWFDEQYGENSWNDLRWSRQDLTEDYHHNASVRPPKAAKDFARFKNAISNAELLAELIKTAL